MKNTIKKLLAFALAFVLTLQIGEVALATAAEEIQVALDPTSQIELSTPEDLSEGNWFFIRERQFEISEKSKDKLYVPIQRTGDLSGEASVTLKLADITSHFGVNYEAEIYRVNQDPESELGEFSLVDAIHENQDTLNEVPELSEEEAADLIAQQGEAEITDGAGNMLGSISVEGEEAPAAEGKEAPAAEGEEAPAGETLTLVPEDVEPAADENAELAEAEPAPATNPLRAARDAFTGTVSDRQPVESSISWMSPALQEIYDNGDGSIPEVEEEEGITDTIPGYTFTLDYAAGESVKFLVITPLYSAKADGDSSILLTLEEPGGSFLLHEDFFTSYAIITDEDVPEPIVVSFSQAEYTAENGKAVLTVTRTGSINEIVTVMVSTYDGSAQQGAEYSGVGAKLYFPMGLESRTLEIPVGHGVKEKDFYVTITPVSECTAGLGTARVVIPAEEQEAELMVAETYLDDAFTDIETFGGATASGTGGTFSPTDKMYETVGLRIYNDWSGLETYFYDGVELTWSADVPRSFSGDIAVYSKTYEGWNEPYSEERLKLIENNSFGGILLGNSFSWESEDFYFGRAKNPLYYAIYAYCNVDITWFYSPATVTVHSVQPIKREFTFEVLPADPLNLRGVPADDESQMNGVYINSSLTDASVTVLSGDSFALTAQNSSEFCRFVGIDAVASDGSTYRIARAAPGTRTMNVTVTESMINALATRDGFVDWTMNYNKAYGAMKGTIKIKPVFEKIPAKVVIGEGTYGSFEGFPSGEYDYYLGERITLKTALNERGQTAGARGSGIGYYKAESKTGVRLDQSNNSPYLNAEMTKVFQIDQPYTNIWPVFDTSGNTVTVQVSGKDLDYFDKTRGILSLDSEPTYHPDTDTWSFIVADDATVNHVMLLYAALSDQNGGCVPLWRDSRSSTQYSGAMFPFRVGTEGEENVIKLSVSTDAAKQLDLTVSGSVQAQEINLATGRPGGRLSPANGALVYYGSGSAVADGSGAFTLPATRVLSGSTVRYAVSYNGALTICEMRTPGRATNNAMNIGFVEIPSFSTLGAHITDVYAIQDKHYMSDVKILEMNGQKTELAARVSPGEGYMLDGHTQQENILGVTFFFLNPLTNELHGEFEAKYDEATDTWRVDLERFTPERADEYTYGDVLYAQLVTDKKVAAVYDAESGNAPGMCYDPVSTGYSVIADADYQPTLFDYSMPTDAESVFGDGGVIQQAGGDPALCDAPYDQALLQGSSTRTTYGEFPFIGELNFILRVTAVVGGNARARAVADQMFALAELESDDAELQGISDVLPEGQLRVGIAMKFGSLPYGGTRFVFAMTFTGGNSLWDQNMSNPWQDTGAASRFFSGGDNYGGWKGAGFKRTSNGFFGPAMFSMSFVIGFYIDFGYLNITSTDGTGRSETRHECVYLGGGGVGGFVGNLSTTAPLPSPIPMYAGFEVEASIMLFLGASKNPNLVLENFKEDKSIDGLDFGFQYQLTGSLTGKGVLGLGFDHALGLRGNVGVKIEMCFSPKFQEWFPNNSYFRNRPFSYGSSLEMSGYLDAVFMNIPLATFSYPLFYQGYLWLFNQMRIGNRVVSFVQKGVNDMLDNGGSKEVIQHCTELCDKILAKIERFENPKAEADELREYAFNNMVINSLEYAMSFSAEVGGLLGMAAKLLDDEEEGTPTWSVQPHVGSEWVAGNDAELMAAFSPEPESTTVVNDVREQTGARLMDIGDNRLLMVFLGDDGERSETQASVLKYAVYNTATREWEIKATDVQRDGTGDYMPDLCDADTHVILSWISTAPEKVPQSDDDPTEHMNQMDVFSVRVPKSELKTGSGGISADAIYQVTNDAAYDSMPRAVYDKSSKDVLLLYTKTLPDTDYKPGSIDQKVLDYTLGGTKVYSVNAYMLYNGVKDDADDYEVGWVTDAFYPNEAAFESEEEKQKQTSVWGYQRFVTISIDGEDDPAISEMSVSRGDDGIAVYAYTVDKDHDMGTSADKELYIQFYNFQTHTTYVPIRMTNDAVAQSMPTLTRSGGDTYLFWLEDSKELKYVDVSTMLNSVIEVKDGVKVYAVDFNGNFADGYTLPVCTVDMSSLTGEDGAESLTGYTVLSNKTTLNGKDYDDLYVIWTAGETYEVKVPGIRTGETRTETCKEIYAAALIHEDDRNQGEETLSANWSKPYRLTDDRKYNDGVSAAIDRNGDLYLVHSQFDMIWHGDDTDWISKHMVARTDQSGNTYYEGTCYEYTQTDLVMTRCIPVGSLEVTQVHVSDETPMPGETVKVTAMLENTGLTTARGCDVKAYETRNGARGQLLFSKSSESNIVVNTGKQFSFDWELPASLTGIGLAFEVSERAPGGYYNPSTTSHTPIKVTSELTGQVLSISQKGDAFEAEIAVKNSGNLAAEPGSSAKVHLECLYGNAREVYGVSDQTLATVDLSDLTPGETQTETLTLNIPASVFDYCGYDALTLRVFSPEYKELDESEQFFVSLEEPMRMKVGDGSDKQMLVGETASLSATYDLSAFRDRNTNVVYTCEDPSVALVMDNRLVAVGTGTTTLTATVLPFGTSASVQVNVVENTSNGDVVNESATVTQDRIDRAIAAQSNGTITVDLSEVGKKITTATIYAEEMQKLSDAVAPEGGAERVELALSDGTVKLDADDVKTLAESGKDVTVTVKNNGNGTVTVDVETNGQSANIDVKVALPAVGSGQVLVIVKPDGTEEIVKKSVVANGTIYAEIPAGSAVKLADKAKPFGDVVANAWYKGAVDFVSSHGLFQGTDVGFEPDLKMNRAMLATVLYRLEGAEATGENPFADVKDGTWYTDAVIWASGAGIVTGTGSGFEPDAPVTREQIAVMLYRYANYLGLDTAARTPLGGFNDGAGTSPWASDAMQWAVSVGLFQGNADGSLNPGGEATRAEVATLLERMVKLIVM